MATLSSDHCSKRSITSCRTTVSAGASLGVGRLAAASAVGFLVTLGQAQSTSVAAAQPYSNQVLDRSSQRVTNSAWADQIRRATTVAERLAQINGNAPRINTGNPVVGGGQRGGFDFNIDDPRMRKHWDPSHYDDEKPYEKIHHPGGHDRGHDRGYYRGYYRGGRHYTGFYYDPWYNDPFYWNAYPYGIDGRLVSGIQPGSQLSMPAPATPTATTAPPPVPETNLEAARRLVVSELFDESIDQYRAHLAEHPDDFEIMAELAVALAGDNRLDDAAALARMAYGKDPTLASRPIDGRLEFEKRALRRLVVRTVRFAHDRDSASAWLLVAVLMQAEDRDAVGLRMVERASARGLSSDISDAMLASLR